MYSFSVHLWIDLQESQYLEMDSDGCLREFAHYVQSL